MKTLINKNNPQIRIIAPEITIEEIEAQDGKIDRYYKVLLGYKYINLLEVYWTLVEEEQPDKETILRICKLHKAWSIMAPWENVEDFVKANWNAENIV